MTKSQKQPFNFKNFLPFSLTADNRVEGHHPLRIYYQDEQGEPQHAVLWSSAALTPSARGACEAYVRALGGEILDVHAEVRVF